MDSRDAVALIESAVRGRQGVWADIGAGQGTFTSALAELLGAGTRIYAVDRDTTALATLRRWARTSASNVTTVAADFTKPFELPGVVNGTLDGLVLANALHFVQDAEQVLTRLVSMLRADGRVVFVEYDRREASQWVPFPISRARLPSLAKGAGLSTPIVTAMQPSRYQGLLYAAAADRCVIAQA